MRRSGIESHLTHVNNFFFFNVPAAESKWTALHAAFVDDTRSEYHNTVYDSRIILAQPKILVGRHAGKYKKFTQHKFYCRCTCNAYFFNRRTFWKDAQSHIRLFSSIGRVCLRHSMCSGFESHLRHRVKFFFTVPLHAAFVDDTRSGYHNTVYDSLIFLAQPKILCWETRGKM